MARNIHLDSEKDLIVAPATAPGRGAIAIIRLSGTGAHELAKSLLPKGSSPPEIGFLKHVRLHSSGDGLLIDDAMMVVWKGPRSYTGEDMVELHVHGSPAVMDAVMLACEYSGARPATPGEFTRRAFLNGKLDLAQAEAVEALASSQTDAARRAALGQLQGGLSNRIDMIRTPLIQTTAKLEAGVDYPEEDLPETDHARILATMDAALLQLQELRETYRRGKRLREGARLVLAGPPNAGKSSLFNALLRRERAIVSPHPGTTRDTLEAVIDLCGIPVTLVDTAGLRDNPGEIEALGIQRTREEVEAADLALFLVDASDPAPALAEYEHFRELPHLCVYNKSDLAKTVPPGAYRLSTKTRDGLAELEEAVVQELTGRESEGGSAVLITAVRHALALMQAIEALQVARRDFLASASPEFVILNLQQALSEIDSITGRGDLDEAILDAIFSTFCLGK